MNTGNHVGGTSAGRSTLANCATEPMPKPIPWAVRHLEGLINELHQTIGFLEERLGQVLAAQPPTGVKDEAKLARHSLALQIDSGACSVDGAAARLQALINRLEL